MTAQPWQLSAEPLDAGRKYAIEALTTFCLLSTVGVAWRIVVGPTANAMTLSPRTLMAAMAAELAFTFVLSYVVLRYVERRGRTPNKLADLTVGIAVLVGR
jgi:hypothetical protein